VLKLNPDLVLNQSQNLKKNKKNNLSENRLKIRMRSFKNSFLTDQQVTDEQKQIDDQIA